MYPARVHIRRLVWMSFILATVPTCSQDLCKVPPTKLVAVLHGRLSMHVPARTEIKPFAVGLMAAQPATTEATGIVLDSGKKRMVVATEETYLRAGKDFEQALRRMDGSTFTIAPLEAAGVKLAFALTPKHLDTASEAIMLLSASVVNSDKTVENVNFYINPPAMPESEACQALSLAIAKTITASHTPLQDAAGERRMAAYGGGELITTVPQGYVLVKQQGPDFVVYRLKKVQLYGAAAYSSLSVYMGRHAQTLPSASGGTLSKENGRLLGQEVTWYQEREVGPNRINQDESVLTLEVGTKDRATFQVHVFALSDTNDMRELRSIADSLRLQTGH